MRFTRRFLSSGLVYIQLLAAALVSASNSSNVSKVEVDDQNIFWPKKKDYVNWLRTLDVGGDYEKLFRPGNGFELVDGHSVQSIDFRPGLHALQDIVAQALLDGKRVRAYGSKWASSNIAYGKEYMVESWGLNYIQVGIDETPHVAPGYLAIKDRLVFVQCGVMIQDMHKALFEKGLALTTTGAADGQRIAGAISTGTHGSAIGYGSMEEYVRGIHIVLTNDEHVFIQRSSDPVVTQNFTEWLGAARLIEDDDMFNAAVVGLGAFGLVHGYVLEAEPLYKLKMQSYETGFAKVRDVLVSLDVASLNFEGVDEMPWHFEVSLNPFKINNKNRGAFVRVFEKIPLTEEELKGIKEKEGVATMGKASVFGVDPEKYDLYGALGNSLKISSLGIFGIWRWLKRWVYSIGLEISLTIFFETLIGEPRTKYPFEFFTMDGASKPTWDSPIAFKGMEIGFPQDKILEVIDVIVDVLHRDPAPMPLAIRFVKKSRATLAFTKYEITAVIEFPCPYTKILFPHTVRVQKKLFKAFEENRDSFPVTYHWGQGLPETDPSWVIKSFGEALDEWKEQREILLDATGRETFSNDLLVQLGLHDD
jgi:hypothetical protein